ncbi:MAG: hypothetical protein SGARI_005080 [Bacillariaceae sp.]
MATCGFAPINPGHGAGRSMLALTTEDVPSSMGFNGGKMKHIFSFEKHAYVSQFNSPEAEQALLNGNMYYKIFGSNGMIQVLSAGDGDPSNLRAYARYDTREKPGDTTVDGKKLTKLPPGKNPDVYPGHSYYYAQVTKDDAHGPKMLDVVQRHGDRLRSIGKEWVSVEWVGTKFNRTPGVPHDVAMAIHQDQQVDPDLGIERSFTGLKKYLLEECADEPVEGLVIEHDGVYWKVKAEGFVEYFRDCPFHGTKKENAKPPIFLA